MNLDIKKYFRLFAHHIFFIFALYSNFLLSIIIGLIGAVIVSHKIGHLYFGHKQYKNSLIEKILSLIYVCILGQGSPMQMAYIHRIHHKFYDTKNDPHSPKFIGKINVYFLNWKAKNIQSKIIKDYSNSYFQKFLNKNYLMFHFIFCLFVLLFFNFSYLCTFISSIVVFSFHFQSITNTFSHDKDGPINNNYLKYFMPWGYKHKDHHDEYSKS